MYDPCARLADPCARLGGAPGNGASLKGEPVLAWPTPRATAGLSDRAVDMGPYNMVCVQVFVTGTNPSGVVSVEGGAERASIYLPVTDPNGSKTATVSVAFDVVCGARWAKVRLASVTGTFLDGQGFTVWVTPYVAPGQPRVTADHIGAGQTAYNTGTGWWMEYNAGTPRMSIGDPAANHVTWDGSVLSIAGTISAILGSIGGWTIGATALTAGTGANSVGLDSGGTNPAIYAGSATPGSAPFRVTKDGAVTAVSGAIGGWTLGATALTAGTGATSVGLDSGGTNPALYAGSATPASAPFRVTQAGALVASAATITGEVNASSGSISGPLTVSGSLQNAASPAARYTLDATGLKLYDSTNTQRAQLLNDGSGWLGDSAVFAWTAAGVVTLNGSAVMPNTITGGKVNFFNVPTIDSLVLTNNSPGAGSVAWSSFTLTYQGTSYTIAAGNTANKFIWWNKATSTTVLQTGATPPAQAVDQFIVAFNEAGAGVASLFSNIVYADYISAVSLAAIQANMGALTIQDVLTMSTNGVIKSGQSAYDTGTGYWLEYNAGTPRLSIGDSTGNKLTWNGSALAITGSVTATVGAIGGWTLGATALTAGSGANSVGLDSGGTNPAVYAGSATPASAPFRVTQAGVVTATSGAVGGWTLGATALTAGSDGTTVGLDSGGTNPALYAGSATPGSAPFRVTQAGALTATSATITGVLTVNDNSSFAGIVSIGASGGIYQGSGSFASPTTGLKIWSDTSIGRIAGYNTGVEQWYASTDGKLYTGAGAVTLDASGVTIIATDTIADVRAYKFYYGGALISRMGAGLVGTQNVVSIYVAPTAGKESYGRLSAVSPASTASIAELVATTTEAALPAYLTVQVSAAGVASASVRASYLAIEPYDGGMVAQSGGVRLLNNVWITARNAAGDGDVNLAKVNASNRVELGAAVLASGDVFASGKGKGLQAQLAAFQVVSGSGNVNLTTSWQDMTGCTVTFTPAVAETVYITVVAKFDQEYGTAPCNVGDNLGCDLFIDGVDTGVGASGRATSVVGTNVMDYIFAPTNLTAAAHTLKLCVKNWNGARGRAESYTHFSLWRMAQ